MKTESELIALAEQHPDDNVANEAMKELRERFDKTYGWCEDCDGLVCKEKDCCLNRLDIDDVSKRYFLFTGKEDGKPTKYLVDDCDDRETAIAKIETEYPNFKWVMTETFNAC